MKPACQLASYILTTSYLSGAAAHRPCDILQVKKNRHPEVEQLRARPEEAEHSAA
jgi:hypothetical protein